MSKIPNVLTSCYKIVANKANEAYEAVTRGVTKGALAVMGALGLGALTPDANAAVTFDGPTQTFSGTFDLTPFYSATGIVIVAIAVVSGIRLAFRSFKGV